MAAVDLRLPMETVVWRSGTGPAERLKGGASKRLQRPS